MFSCQVSSQRQTTNQEIPRLLWNLKIPCSQHTPTSHHPEPDECIPQFLTAFPKHPKIHVQNLKFIYRCLGHSKKSAQIRGPLRLFFNKIVFIVWSCQTPANSKDGGCPLVGCPRLLIKQIHSYPPYLKAVSCIRNPRMRHTVVTGTHTTWRILYIESHAYV
jgi:hypothetical protein